MKVLWITSVYPSDIEPGKGVFHETQVQALIQSGVQVTVICPVPKNPKMLRFLKKQYQGYCGIPPIYRRKGVTVYRPTYLALPGQLRWAQPNHRIAASIIETINEQEIEADLIHAHFAMPSGGAAKLIATQKGLPWVLTLHGSDVNVYPNYSASAKQAFIKTVKAANGVLTVGKSLQKKTKEMAGREASVLPIGVDLSLFNPCNQSKMKIRSQLQLPQNRKLILFVGRLIEEKGVFELAQALDRLPKNVALVLVGDGPAKEKLLQHQEIGSRIFLPGQIENEQVKDYLIASDVFALPSYSEGMPTVVIEALALKIPVVSTAVGSIPELFGEHSHLLVEPRSVKGLVDRLEDFLYGRLDVKKYQEDLFEHIQNHYHAEQNARLLRAEYQRVLDTTL